MNSYSLAHLTDGALLHEVHTLVARDRSTTAALLAHLAEVDDRKLYLPAAYPSMFAWCLGELRLSEDSALKRIAAGRAARRFAVIYSMVADGRLHLSGVVQLAPHLTTENVGDLLAAAAGRTKAQIERLIAERFPRPDLETVLAPVAPLAPLSGLAAPVYEDSLAPGRVNICTTGAPEAIPASQLPTPTTNEQPMVPAASVAASIPAYTRVSPLAPGRFALQVTVSQATHDKLRRAQALLGHSVPSGDIAQALDRALDLLIMKLEHQRFAATERPRAPRRCGNGDARHIPAEIRRQVWKRDGGQCTFVGDNGHRCEARARLEFDHVQPFARGGRTTPSGLRLRCRAHNQLEAERAYGKDFMAHKREEARRRALERVGGEG